MNAKGRQRGVLGEKMGAERYLPAEKRRFTKILTDMKICEPGNLVAL
jgi:hypothetical protein